MDFEEIMASAAQNLESGGAVFIIICTNTMHEMAEGISAKISLPIIHIANVTAEKLRLLLSQKWAFSAQLSQWSKISIKADWLRSLLWMPLSWMTLAAKTFMKSFTMSW